MSGFPEITNPSTLRSEPNKASLDAIVQYLNSKGGRAWIPSGTGQPFFGSTAPTGWLLCDGSVVSQVAYADLFAVIGTIYNTGGEGTGNFRLPDMRGFYPVGTVTTLGASVGTGLEDQENRAVGQHTHTQNAHTHTQNQHRHSYNDSQPINDIIASIIGGPNHVDRGDVGRNTGYTTAVNQNATAVNQDSGSTSGTNAPYLQVNYIIKT